MEILMILFVAFGILAWLAFGPLPWNRGRDNEGVGWAAAIVMSLGVILIALEYFSTYSIAVDYDQNVEQILARGGYDADKNITNENFPTAGGGKKTIKIVLLKFNGAVRARQVLAVMERQGLRPATLQEILALGSAYPSNHYIFALGSIWTDELGFHEAPFTVQRWEGHKVGLYCIDHSSLISFDWFAAVKP